MVMEYKTPAEKFIPQVAQFVREFERKCPTYRFVVHSTSNLNDDAEDRLWPTAYFFCVKNPEEKAGYIHYDRGAEKWIVQSRFIENNKFRPYSREYRTKSTSSYDKAMKLAQSVIVPYSYKEIAIRTITGHTKLNHMVNRWYGASHDRARRVFMSINQDVLLKEIVALKNQGVSFITPEFARAAEEGIAEFKEYLTRKEMVTNKYFVQECEEGRYAVTLRQGDSDDMKDATVYNTLEAVPEFIRSGMSLLKMMGDDAQVDEVGIRISKNQYVILETVAKTKTV